MRRALALRLLSGGLLCAAVAGCSIPSPFAPGPLPNEPGNLAVDRRVCAQSVPLAPGNYLARAQCINAAVERDAIPFARYPDLVRMQEQARLKYSAMIDRGQISPREGERKMAEADALVDGATQDRDRGNRRTAAHRVDRLQALLQ
jgi:hypothetical protein